MNRIAVVIESLSRADDMFRSCFETFDAGERRRADGFADEDLRRRFVAGRGVLRTILARHLDCAPESVRLETGSWGKPRLAGDHSLKFNLSHSGDCLAVALSWVAEVGIDIERACPEVWPDLEAMAEHAFQPETAKQIAALPPRQRIAAFYRQWTRQEAILKARGAGFSRATPSSPSSAVTVRDLALGSTLGSGWFAALAAEGGDFEVSVSYGSGTMDFARPGRYSPASLAARRAPEIRR